MKIKNIAILACVLFASLTGFAQEEDYSDYQDLGKNEFTLNMLYSVAGIPEIKYERHLSDESSIGLSAAVALVDDIDLEYMVTPFYRFYFGNKPSAGFFIEANTALFSEDVGYDVYYYPNGDMETKSESEFGFGMGFAAGGKFMTKSGFVFEIYGGLGRNFLSDDESYASEVYPRIGLTFGKRF